MDELATRTKNLTKSSLDPAGILDKKTVAAPVAAPDPGGPGMPDEDATKAAARRKQAAMQNRGGRASTILSAEQRLGG